MSDPLLKPARDTPSKPKPSVGRVVHFYKSALRCIPAIITNINETTGAVNLILFDDEISTPHYFFNAKEGKRMSTWHWPEQA